MINFNDVINNKVESKRGIVILNFKNGYNVLILCVVNGVIGIVLFYWGFVFFGKNNKMYGDLKL